MEKSDYFKTWVAKLIDSHQDTTEQEPVVKLKSLENVAVPEDEKEIQSRINCLKEEAVAEYVELRMDRNLGEWQPESRLIRIISLSGAGAHSLGFQNADGKFLTPFEALFLLENNRLEILNDDIPWTVFEAYRTLLPRNDDVLKYKYYRKFALLGVYRDCPMDNSLEEIHQEQKRFKTTHPDDDRDKIKCINQQNVEKKTFSNIFEELIASGPQTKVPRFQQSKIPNYITSDELNANFFESASNLCVSTGESFIGIQPIQTTLLPSEGD